MSKSAQTQTVSIGKRKVTFEPLPSAYPVTLPNRAVPLYGLASSNAHVVGKARGDNGRILLIIKDGDNANGELHTFGLDFLVNPTAELLQAIKEPKKRRNNIGRHEVARSGP